MMTSLDLLVIVFMAMAAVSLLALCLMFMVRNPQIKKVCFYIVSALGIYAGSVGISIGNFMFPVQTVVGAIVAVVSIAAIALVVLSKGDQKKYRIARLAAAAALIVGIMNAFFF